jgi:O-6-methylguanine DNA methyltransferase
MRYVIELPSCRLMIRIKDLELRELFFTEESIPEEGYKFRSKGEEELYKRTSKQLSEYFQGKRTTFDLLCHFIGSALETVIWKEVNKIKYGTTISYSELAWLCGKPNAVRAVASAVGRNKLMILIPCHRVILKTGESGNYGGGEANKKMLLELEQKNNVKKSC